MQRYARQPARMFRWALTASLVIMAGVSLGCAAPSKGTNANSVGSNQKPGNENANAGSRTTGSQSANIDIKDPERYGVTMTLSIQENASDPRAVVLPQQQLSLAKLGADRRWTFVFPTPLGQIVYLEKSGLNYIVLYERKQYVELTPDALGFQLGDVLTPHSIADRLKPGQFEELGLEPVNGRTAIKYRVFAAAASAQTDGAIYVDQETRLPLRSELNRASSAGAKTRVIVEVRDVQLNPDRAQFDVPIGMKKITQQEASHQIESFANALRIFAAAISGVPFPPVARPGQAAGNNNASRSGR